MPSTYTPVPDALFDELLAELSGAELKVLMYVIRWTHGFGRTTDRISLRQLQDGITRRDGRVLDHGTGLLRTSILHALAMLEARGLVERRVDTTECDRGEAAEILLSFAPALAPPPSPAAPTAVEYSPPVVLTAPSMEEHATEPAINRCVRDFSRELHDEQHTSSNITRAGRLWKRSGMGAGAFCRLMYEARAISKAQNHIHKEAEGRADGTRNRVPYFFAVLENLLVEASEPEEGRHSGRPLQRDVLENLLVESTTPYDVADVSPSADVRW